jgi:hypothetical protein
MKQGLTELGVILVLVLPKTSLVINIMGISNGGMDNGQVSQKGMMIKIECKLQIIKGMDENDELDNGLPITWSSSNITL